MKKILLFICLSFFLSTCAKKETSLQFVTKTFHYKSDINCETGNCTYVHFEIPIASGKPTISNAVNQQIFDFIQNTAFKQVNKTVTSYDSLAINFINQYNEINRTYPNDIIAWEANFKVNHQPLANKVYQIVWDYYLFTGGAHGLQATKVFLLDITTGKQIPEKELFLNYEGFKKYAETEFKQQQQISGNLNSAGFTFEKNVFKLPENFYETTTHWVLHYNPYEIAPYVKGATVVKLPKQQVQHFLNPLYFKD